MFTPIKNLITYIQKNASGSTFFGGTSSSFELNDTTAPAIMEGELVKSNCSIGPLLPTDEVSPMNEKNHDQNENEVLEIVSTVNSNADDPLLLQEDDVEKDIFLDFPPEIDNEEENDVDFPTTEVIVLEDPDLNTSVISEPGADPLAIDECSGPPVNQLDTSTDGDVLYMVDIDEIERKTAQITDDTEEAGVLAAAKTTDEQELRSDGSDSGLGSETSALQSTVTSTADISTCSTTSTSPVIEMVPMRSNLKRHLQEVVNDGEHQVQKKPRRSINFDGVKVFYFPRIQGHGCVPSQGGCTLGMGAHHISFKTFSLAEHAAELRRAHKLQLQEINPRGSSSDESDSDEELSEGSGSDLDADTNGFLQPVSPKQRRALLKVAGVRKIDPNEKIECRDIRNSREVCGCVCRNFCDPDTCACSQAGIKCQVDRAMFPCGCSRDACGNASGRIEFNPARVRTHYIHTIMRLEMENRQQKRSHELGSQQAVPVASHLAYNSVPGIASTTGINSYNTIPAYGLEQNSTAIAVYHHHMQQHNAYINHMPPTHPVSSAYVSLIDTPTSALPLPQSHIHYVNTTAIVEPSSISSGNLHYQDASMYPPVLPCPLPQPPATTYGDILAPYATSTPYHSAQMVDASYSVYNNFHNPHNIQNHLQQQPFLGYTTACSGDLSEYNESQSSFISLNTPEASSSRLSAINDLLHNNRNTTAALVAVSPVSTEVNTDDACIVDEQGQETDTYTSDRADETETEEKVSGVCSIELDEKEEECETFFPIGGDQKQKREEGKPEYTNSTQQIEIPETLKNNKSTESETLETTEAGNSSKGEPPDIIFETNNSSDNDASPPSPPIEQARSISESVDTPKTTKPKVVEPSHKNDDFTSTSDKKELNSNTPNDTSTINEPSPAIGSEEERIADTLPLIVETVSA